MPPLEDEAYEVASRVASTFKSVYDIGDQQFSALLKAIEEGVAISPSFNLDALLADLYEQNTQYSLSVASKLEPFIKSKPFKLLDTDAWAEMLTSKQNHVHVLQLAGVARVIQKLITEFVLWDLYAFACSNGSKNKPIPIVLDEIQNLDHGSDSPIDKMLREGRKFGLSLILATQTTSNFNQEQRDRLFQASHKLFFKPANTEVSAFADILSKATQIPKKDWEQRLSNLQKGQCWSLGQVMTSSGQLKEDAVLVDVTPLESRFVDRKD